MSELYKFFNQIPHEFYLLDDINPYEREILSYFYTESCLISYKQANQRLLSFKLNMSLSALNKNLSSLINKRYININNKVYSINNSKIIEKASTSRESKLIELLIEISKRKLTFHLFKEKAF